GPCGPAKSGPWVSGSQRPSCPLPFPSSSRWVLAGEVVPRALRADLDVVTEDRLAPTTQPVELGGGCRTPTSGRKAGPKDVGHLDGGGRLADRAAFPTRLAHV